MVSPHSKHSLPTRSHGTRLARLVGAAAGLLALIWFLARVIPKPSRAAYPCQRAAFPVASAFVLWVAGLLGGWALIERLRKSIPQLRAVVMVVGLTTLIGVVPWDAVRADTAPNTPVGTALGINPGRVVWAHDPTATLWSGSTTDGTHWWDPTQTVQAKVDAMFSADLQTLTSTTSDAAAWDALFRAFNVKRGNGSIGYAASANQIIAVKINENPTNQGNNNYYTNNGVSGDANAITANPHLILSLVNSLVAVGVAETNIYICDPTSLNHQWGGNRTIGDSIYTYVHPLHTGVHFVDGVGQQGREAAVWPTTDQIVYANAQGVTATLGTKIAQQFLDAGFIINMAIMKSHNDGPTGVFKNHYGAVSGQRHGPIYGVSSGGSPTYYANTIEPMGHQQLGQKEMLFMIDALYGSSTPNADPTKWTIAPFNSAWPASVFMSQDPVAIDSVEWDFLNAEFGLPANTDNYLYEAASIPDATGKKPSGVVYEPTSGSTAYVGSLGVFEHWNNVTAKQYSRNLDPVNGKGIELVTAVAGAATDAGDAGHAGDSGTDTGAPVDSGAATEAGGGTDTGLVNDVGSPADTKVAANDVSTDAGSEPESAGASNGCSCRLTGAASDRGTMSLVAMGGLALAIIGRRRFRRGRRLASGSF